MTLGSVKSYVATNIWIVFTSMIGSIGSMLLVYWKRHSFPLNLALLGLFTGFESIAVGFVASQYSTTIVLQALVITSFVFIGLTLFTFQSKYDFSSMGRSVLFPPSSPPAIPRQPHSIPLTNLMKQLFICWITRLLPHRYRWNLPTVFENNGYDHSRSGMSIVLGLHRL
jgi:hypothetical protein